MKRKLSPIGWLIIFLLFMSGPGEALINGGVSGMLDWFMSVLLMIPGIIVGLSFHEFAHAKAADLCGDPTPRYQGRVTIDPRAHVDPFGLLALVFIGFGWGRPVMIYPPNFKRERLDRIIVGVAGVAMNLLLAFVFSAILGILYRAVPQFLFSSFGTIVSQVLFEVIAVNLSLMLFNLIPIPPLDGFGILCDVFNLYGSGFYYFVTKNSRIIFVLFLLFDIPSLLLSRPLNFLLNLMLSIW